MSSVAAEPSDAASDPRARRGGAHDGGPGEFVKALTLTDATMLVAGSMIGSGIFIVSADIGRTLQSPAGPKQRPRARTSPAASRPR